MINQLFATLKYSGAIAISILNIQISKVNATEYVFSAPPEVDKEIVEIPTQEEDYPFYECESASASTSENELRDSHNCECIEDCEPKLEGTEEQENTESRSLEN